MTLLTAQSPNWVLFGSVCSRISPDLRLYFPGPRIHPIALHQLPSHSGLSILPLLVFCRAGY